tara:strand:+ start:101 stop:307 length:207 start_codon:yes stop_codon:yes gene_type:complete
VLDRKIVLQDANMKKSYTGPYYVVGKESKEIFTWKKDVGRYYKIYGTFKQMQETLSKKGLILTREVEN